MAGNVERTGWRDQRISDRHRLWGDNLGRREPETYLHEFTRGAVGAIQRRVALDPEKLLAGTATN